jgi:transcriptional regulator with XRE-family HTH domain
MECKTTNRLRVLRELKGLKRHELAVALAVDPTTVYRWETGAAEMGDETKAKVAEFFDVSRAYLMGWEMDEQEVAA